MLSKKIRFGIIGTNFIVDWILEAARLDPRFEAVAIYSRTQEQADAFATKHNIPHTYTDLGEMAKSPLIDAVYIASPNYCHASQSILFMEYGKHVLCEKPIASNTQETLQMINCSIKNRVTLMEAMKSTLTPGFSAIKDNLCKIGTIRRYFASYCQYSSRYDKLKSGELPNAFNPDLSNGAVMDLGIYTIYPMVVLFGKPTKISASGLLLHTGVDGQGAINFEYPNMNATVIYSKIVDSFLPTEIQGEDGVIITDRINSIKDVSIGFRNGYKENISPIDDRNEYYYEIAEFINLIESQKVESSINSHQNSLITIEIIDEIRSQLGISFPADKR